jgi:hypothetical protein
LKCTRVESVDSGSKIIILGVETVVSGYFSFVFGVETAVSGYFSFVFGVETAVSGYFLFVFGDNHYIFYPQIFFKFFLFMVNSSALRTTRIYKI